MSLEPEGAQCFKAAIAPDALRALIGALRCFDKGSAGERLGNVGSLVDWIAPGGPIGHVAAGVLGPRTKPVRAILFDKSEAANWSLGWHQDRTIAVKSRHEVTGFGPWTIKDGITHVEPPMKLLARMITLRVHLDPVGPNNGPLLISPGTHLLGKVTEDQITRVVQEHGVMSCLAEPGDIWAYRTPIMHASARSASGTRRRVLQIDFSADDLPEPLDWALG